MKRNIFKIRLFYYLVILLNSSILLFSLMRTISVFENFSIVKLIIILIQIAVNIVTIISLLEKYKNVMLWLNMSIIIILIKILFEILFFKYPSDSLYKWCIFFGSYLLLINIFKNKEFKQECIMAEEIEELGKITNN